MKKLGIIDYGMGNLHSVIGALNYIGLENFVSADRTELTLADALILPGVGAFPDAMDSLNKLGLNDFIKNEVKIKPLLGICLGMQLLFKRSFEFKECEGLGLIGGDVIKLTAYEREKRIKIPHMGWNVLDFHRKSSLTRDLPEKSYVYFVHSFKGVTENCDDLIASTEYGEEISAVVSHGNVYGTQFHPEKSENTGLSILRNFGGLL